MQYFRELQSLLQQFIIVEHAVDPAIDPAAVDQQAANMDQAAALETMKQETSAAEAVTEMEGGMSEMAEEASVDMGLDMPSTMDTSSADNQMEFEQDQQTSAEPFVAEETGPSDIA